MRLSKMVFLENFHRMSQRRPNRGPPNLPKDEPAIPLEPGVANARTIYIKAQLATIRRLKEEGKSIDEIREEVARFAEDYPQLFKLVTRSEGFDESSLRTMLSMLEKMGTGELSQHQASVIIGQRLHDQYIKPAVDKENSGK
jgi:hypothetical protein